jgi:hypothetical protein
MWLSSPVTFVVERGRGGEKAPFKKKNHDWRFLAPRPLRPDLEWDQDQEFLDLDGKKIEKRQKDHYISNELFKI